MLQKKVPRANKVNAPQKSWVVLNLRIKKADSGTITTTTRM
nr:hypothetical protein [Liquorilactobacillus nagelii]